MIKCMAYKHFLINMPLSMSTIWSVFPPHGLPRQMRRILALGTWYTCRAKSWITPAEGIDILIISVPFWRLVIKKRKKYLHVLRYEEVMIHGFNLNICWPKWPVSWPFSHACHIHFGIEEGCCFWSQKNYLFQAPKVKLSHHCGCDCRCTPAVLWAYTAEPCQTWDATSHSQNNVCW